ncbi:MAG: T9SS type A sorting domain-containing protein, partial [Fibrobacteres bacterium]|nr:T9SS type A sorting domain-containing protein [Fibrobacterota bacterium]
MLKRIIYLFMALSLYAEVDFENLIAGKWVKQPLSGTNFTGVPFTSVVDIHLATDTSGNTYFFGACGYGGVSNGTHNNEAFRINVKTGATELLYTCGTNPWPGGCQAGQCYDSKRNCIWFSAGQNALCQTNVEWFKGKAYYSGVYKFQCPSGPITKVSDTTIYGKYWRYDAANDLILSSGVNGYGYRPCVHVFDPNTNGLTLYLAPSDAGLHSDWEVPTAFDPKRSQIAFTMWKGAGTYADIKSFYFFNSNTKSWTTKTPTVSPDFVNGELAFDEVNDKYVYFGGHTNCGLWQYDYDSNSWTNITDSVSKPWPTHKYKAGWDYCKKYNCLVSLGGAGSGYSPASPDQPQGLWIYRLKASTGTSSEKVRKVAASFKAGPNPASSGNRIFFSYSNAEGMPVTVKIYDIAGKVVFTGNDNANSVSWNSEGFPA